MQPERIPIEDVKRRIEAGERLVFLDTRSADAWEQAELQIPGSIRVPPDEVESRLSAIPRQGLIVPYCT